MELNEILIEKFGKTEGKAIREYIEAKVDREFDVKLPVIATKQDLSDLEVRLTQKIFVSGVVQFITTVRAMLAIIAFMMKK